MRNALLNRDGRPSLQQIHGHEKSPFLGRNGLATGGSRRFNETSPSQKSSATPRQQKRPGRVVYCAYITGPAVFADTADRMALQKVVIPLKKGIHVFLTV
jgi:hypothetical protein